MFSLIDTKVNTAFTTYILTDALKWWWGLDKSGRWDDTDNTNAFKEPLPYYNNHRNNTRLSFCCITNGSKTIPIDLPTTNPFYLLPFKSIDCQQVKWMISNSEWIKYDKENTGTDYSSIDGVVPYNTLNSNKDITNFYCYYQSKYITTTYIWLINIIFIVVIETLI
jgi:hypothetical protein